MSNPLLNYVFDIPFDEIKAEQIEPAISELLAQADQELDALITAQGPRTKANTLAALDRLGENLWYSFGIVSHLESVITTPDLREAYNKVLPAISAFGTKIQLSQGVFQALKDFSQTEESQSISPTWKRSLKLSLEDFHREGAELPADKKERLEQINQRLTEITTRFRQNVTDSTAKFELFLDDSQVEGLPQSALDAAKQSAESKGEKGYRFTLQAPSYQAVVTYLKDSSIREKMWRAYSSRATEDNLDNRVLIPEILALRKEKAHLLGFENFGDYVLEPRMAKFAKTAIDFEENLTDKYKPFFEKENQELQTFKNLTQTGRLEPWDISYYAELQRKAKFDFDEEALRPYFALPKVVKGLFSLCEKVFGFVVKKIEGIAVWHPEVEVFNIEKDGKFIARFYTDWFPRDSKRGGAWMNSFITGNRDEGATEPHLGLMIGNLTPPVGDKPALLTHREVETIFHEFGHLIHHALSNVETKGLAGTSVPWDFVELPSQIMENWTWEKDALDMFATHFQTGEPIPKELFDKMFRARTYRAANDTMRQLSFGTLDLSLHVKFDGKSDPVAYTNSIMQNFTPAQLPDDYGFIAGFTHIFGSSVGYASGYYSYKWAEVLDADAFSRFKQEGIFNSQTGNDFVDNILSKGNSDEPAQLFRNFMGRDPNPDALLERTGLKTG